MIENQKNQINWFPGHMKKATDELKDVAKKVDFVIEVVDARGISVTSNQEIKYFFSNKPIIKIALKSDLSDLQESECIDFLFINVKNQNDRKKIINKLELIFRQKKERLQVKGLLIPEFIGIVVGLPNIGKSSLINLLIGKKQLKSENRCGVTKKQVLKKINNNFYLIDTPGIFFKKVNYLDDGYKLSILNCVNKNVVPLYDVIKFVFSYFVENYQKELFAYFQINNILNFDKFINEICLKFKFINVKNDIDIPRCLDYLYSLFSLSKICKFHFK